MPQASNTRLTSSRKRRVTIKDIAAAAGVSHTTVSWVLNDKPGVKISDDTRERIHKLAIELGYRPNHSAKSLITDTSNTIGFVTEDIATGGYAGETVSGAQQVIWDSGKLMLIVHSGSDQSFQQAAFERLRQHNVDGLIFGTMSHRPFEVPAQLSDLPLVLMNCFDSQGRYSQVVPDDFDGAYQAVSYLIACGHTRIGFILGEGEVHAASQRLAGYRWALEEAGLGYEPALITRQSWTIPGGFEGTNQLLALEEPPTAIFCINDIVAMGCYDALKAAGKSIGRNHSGEDLEQNQIAVIGFDDLELAAQMRPALTTVALPHAEIGQWAAEQLLQQLSSNKPLPPKQQKMPCPLIVRDSA